MFTNLTLFLHLLLISQSCLCVLFCLYNALFKQCTDTLKKSSVKDQEDMYQFFVSKMNTSCIMAFVKMEMAKIQFMHPLKGIVNFCLFYFILCFVFEALFAYFLCCSWWTDILFILVYLWEGFTVYRRWAWCCKYPYFSFLNARPIGVQAQSGVAAWF